MRYGALALVAFGFGLSLSGAAAADDATPPVVGTWQTWDDKTGKPNGAVRTFVRDGKLIGQIAALRPNTPPNEPCPACKGADKGKPLMGLVVLWNMKPDTNQTWSGGTIMDPESGDTYRCNIKVVSNDEIEVRGFIGISAFGRTQHWKRIK
jgi:uncharacterized protein (DUF2147 family)